MPSSHSLEQLSHRLRTAFHEPSSNSSIFETNLLHVDAFIDAVNATGNDELLRNFASDLRGIYSDIVARSDNPQHTELFIAVLSRLAPVLSSSSIISDWFDVCLRPALRNPELSAQAIRHAKDLIFAALHSVVDQYSKLVSDFRRRLLDLYLRDAFNEGAGADILEWAEMGQRERDVKTVWKTNLEDILIKHGTERPADLLDEVNDDYVRKPTHRLQLLTLLTRYTSQTLFSSDVAPILAGHPLIDTLLLSLQLDNSTTACSLALTVLVKVLPMFAMSAGELLKVMIPRMLLVLARMICFKLPSKRPLQDTSPDANVDLSDGGHNPHPSGPTPRPDLHWRTLEQSYEGADRQAPSPYALFTLLYYLYPCNLIRFLRSPLEYLHAHDVVNPFVGEWTDLLDPAQLKSKSEPILHGHIVHPSLIWADADEELANEGRWTQYDVSRIIGECTILDVRHARFAVRHPNEGLDAERDSNLSPVIQAEEMGTPRMQPRNLSREQNASISLQGMVETSLLLRSGHGVHHPSNGHIVGRSVSLPPENYPSDLSIDLQSHGGSSVVQLMTKLQREVVLLRNELNLELWLNRENVKHIGRLHQQQVTSRNAEIERQALHNRLRQYKSDVTSLRRSFANHEKSASNAQEKYHKWSQDLQSKLQQRREQIRHHNSETALLRSENADLRTKLAAQSRLLEDATRQVFLLETQIKETAHKVDRLRDYEKRIDQLTATQRLWDDDVQKLKDQKEQMSIMFSNFKGMQLRLESYEHANIELSSQLRDSLAQVRILENAQEASPLARWNPSKDLASAAAERAKLDEDNTSLRRRLTRLQVTVETLRLEMENMKASNANTARPLYYED